jgi:hypothetical protein
MSLDKDDIKELNRLRYYEKRKALADGWQFYDRTVPSEKVYRRNLKHRPQTADEWEELED